MGLALLLELTPCPKIRRAWHFGFGFKGLGLQGFRFVV